MASNSSLQDRRAWPLRTLREANVILIDCDHRTPPAQEQGYPYVTIPQLKNGRIELSSSRRISPEHYAEWTRKAKPSAFDVVLSRRCNPGETAFVPPDVEFALGQNLVLLRADGSEVYPPFLRWLVSGPEWWDQIKTFLNVGAVFESLKCADIPKFTLCIPPLDEQKAIADFLGYLDSRIEVLQNENSLMAQIAQAIFKSWFVDFDPVRAKAEGRKPQGMDADTAALFPSEFQESELGAIPKGWSIESIGDLTLRVSMGPFGSNIKTDNFIAEGVPIIRGKNLRDGFIDDDFVFLSDEKADELRNANAFAGDIVITHRGTLGQVGRIPEGSRFPRYVVSQSQMVLTVDSRRATSLFVYHYLTSMTGQNQLLANTSQVGVPAIARPTMSVKAIKLPLSERIALMHAFESLIGALADRINMNSVTSRTLTDLRDTLLPRLISGKLRVPEAEKLVEAVL
jgi:type I restriction enzyme S subunit